MMFDTAQIARNIHRGAYRLIGYGSGRMVYDLGQEYVAKIAKNRKGIGQNKAEYQISLQDNSGLFAGIPHASDDLRIIIMEKAKRLKSISDVWRYYHVRNNEELSRIPEIKDALAKHSLIFVDLCRPRNWGVLHGRPVIVDYGFTWSVNRDYYMK